MIDGFTRYIWIWPVQDSCCCFWIVLVGFIWLLKVLYLVGWLWPVPDGGGRSLLDLLSLFSISGLILCSLMAIASYTWFLLVQNSYSCGMVLAGYV